MGGRRARLRLGRRNALVLPPQGSYRPGRARRGPAGSPAESGGRLSEPARRGHRRSLQQATYINRNEVPGRCTRRSWCARGNGSSASGSSTASGWTSRASPRLGASHPGRRSSPLVAARRRSSPRCSPRSPGDTACGSTPSASTMIATAGTASPGTATASARRSSSRRSRWSRWAPRAGCSCGPAEARPFPMRSGDLLVTGGRTQPTWEHCLPKVAHAGPRLSLAFRHGLDSRAYEH